MPGDPGATVVTNARVFYTTRAAAGASGTRHSPRPLGRKDFLATTRAHRAARLRTLVWICVIASEAKQSIAPSSFRDGPKDQTSDVQLHIGESRDSGFASSTRPGMTKVALNFPSPGCDQEQ